MRKADGTPAGNFTWSPVKIGGLGFVTGGAFASDGSLMVCRTDVGGAYIRAAGQEAWAQLIDASRLTVPAWGSAVSGQDVGVYAIDIAPSSASTLLLAYRGHMFRSTNGGASFTDDSLNGTTGLYMGANDGVMRLRQNKMKFDPSNANVAYLGLQNDGLWRRLSTGWAKVASVPNPSLSDNATIVAIDNTSATTGSSPNVRRSVVYVAVSGQGLYKSTDGGGTFSLISGHPGAGGSFALSHMVCDQNGKLWICLDNGANNNVYTTTNGGTSWAQITNTPPYNVGAVEVDPKDATRIVGLCGAGKPFTSTDSGATWVGAYEPIHNWSMPTACPIAATEVQFQLQSQDAGSANILPHPTLNKDFVWGGYGVYFINSPWPGLGTKALIRYEDTKGTEELVAYHADIHPDGTTFCSAGDRGVIVQDKTGKYATINWPNGSLTDGTNVDYAIDNQSFKVTVCHRGGLTDFSGYSSDGGTTWTKFTTAPSTGTAGHIAVSNSNQVVYFPCQNKWPQYSSDNGATWHDITFTGFSRVADGTENGFGFGSPFGYRRHIVCADKANAGAFYCYNYGFINGVDTPSVRGVWKSTDGGQTFAKVGNPGTTSFGWHAGLICTPNGHLYINTGPLSSTTTDDTGLPSFRSEDGGVTWTALATIDEVNCLAWGAPKPGNAVPYALYALGWINSSTFGLYRSDDKGATWIARTNCPANNFDWPQCMAADPVTFGRVVIGYTGTGFQEGTYRYAMTLS